MIKAAEQLGFSAKGVKGDQNAFFSEFPLPAIAHVVVNGSLLHYVVYYQHVLGLPMNFFGTRKVGEIVSRFTDLIIILFYVPMLKDNVSILSLDVNIKEKER